MASNVPPELEEKFKRCKEKVMGQGKDESAAYGICYAAIVEGKSKAVKEAADYGFILLPDSSFIEGYGVKAESYGGTPRKELKDSDFVFSDERVFPIMTAQDVRDAVSSWGRYRGGKSFDEFKRRLTALARRKGFDEIELSIGIDPNQGVQPLEIRLPDSQSFRTV